MTLTSSQSKDQIQERIAVKRILKALSSNVPLIAGFSGLSTLIVVVLNSMLPRIWAGSFTMLISESGQGNAINFSSLLGSFGLASPIKSLAGSSPQVDTKIHILKSRSVLLPVFNELAKRSSSYSSYGQWSKGINIAIVPGTEIIRTTFHASDKTTILPTLIALSKAFQQFSNLDQVRSIETSIGYAEVQADNYRRKVADSTTRLNQFRLKYGIKDNQDSSISNLSIPRSGLSTLSATSRIDSPPNLLFDSGATRSAQSAGQPISQLSSLNQEIVRRKQIYTDNDPVIKNLEVERDALRKYLELTAFGKITLPGKQALTKEQANSIILEYENLSGIAMRDKSALESMENSLVSLKLQQAQTKTPWQILSSPDVDSTFSEPKTSRNIILGFIFGLFSSSGFFILQDLRKGFLNFKEEYSESIDIPELAEVNSLQDLEGVALLIESVHNNSPLAIVDPSGAWPSSMQDTYKAIDSSTNCDVFMCNDLISAKNGGKVILLFCPASLRSADIPRIKTEINALGDRILGMIWIASHASLSE